MGFSDYGNAVFNTKLLRLIQKRWTCCNTQRECSTVGEKLCVGGLGGVGWGGVGDGGGGQGGGGCGVWGVGWGGGGGVWGGGGGGGGGVGCGGGGAGGGGRAGGGGGGGGGGVGAWGGCGGGGGRRVRVGVVVGEYNGEDKQEIRPIELTNGFYYVERPSKEAPGAENDFGGRGKKQSTRYFKYLKTLTVNHQTHYTLAKRAKNEGGNMGARNKENTTTMSVRKGGLAVKLQRKRAT